DSARELYVSQPAERELTGTVDTRDIPDGKHHLVLEGTLRTGEVVRSEPLEVIVDNCPPGLVRIDSVLRVDGAADGDPKGSLMVEVKATVEDDAGISLVELYDTPPDTIDRPIAASEHIEDGACSLLGVLNRSTRTTHCLYLKAYDQAGNYRIDRVTVPF
ncbi:MAG TPA: hypothetical protein PKA95_15240, partial [Thermomicrobiales bacterium]|nr:hypothetical protein [Thermomicrobiales bacterium]